MVLTAFAIIVSLGMFLSHLNFHFLKFTAIYPRLIVTSACCLKKLSCFLLDGELYASARNILMTS